MGRPINAVLPRERTLGGKTALPFFHFFVTGRLYSKNVSRSADKPSGVVASVNDGCRRRAICQTHRESKADVHGPPSNRGPAKTGVAGSTDRIPAPMNYDPKALEASAGALVERETLITTPKRPRKIYVLEMFAYPWATSTWAFRNYGTRRCVARLPDDEGRGVLHPRLGPLRPAPRKRAIKNKLQPSMDPEERRARKKTLERMGSRTRDPRSPTVDPSITSGTQWLSRRFRTVGFRAPST